MVYDITTVAELSIVHWSNIEHTRESAHDRSLVNAHSQSERVVKVQKFRLRLQLCECFS